DPAGNVLLPCQFSMWFGMLAAWPLIVVDDLGCTAAGAIPRRVRRKPRRQRRGSELQAALARRIGQGLDATVVAVARAVERDLLDAGRTGLLGNRLADAGGRVDVLAALQALADFGLGGRGRGQDRGAVGGEQLGVEVLAGAQHRQARHAEFADVRAGGAGATQAGNLLVHRSVPRS